MVVEIAEGKQLVNSGKNKNNRNRDFFISQLPRQHPVVLYSSDKKERLSVSAG